MKITVGKMPRCFALSIYGNKKRIMIRVLKYCIEVVRA